MAKKKMSEGLENALQKLVDRLVERMEDASQSLEWNKGWIQTGHGWGLPRNISGSPYMGMNAFLLSLHAAENSYKMPIYMTHLQAKKEKVHILPGSKSVPVFKWGMNIKDKEGKFVSEEDYRKMSEEQQKECTVFPYLKYFNEFNIDQTNYKEKYPDKYEKLLSNFVDPDRNKADTNGMYNNEALNKVIEEKDGWICPIVLDPSKGAAYSPGFNSIHIPPKENYRLHEGNAEETFKDGQEYYSTALHEMAHSTGHESVLKRDGIVKFDGFGSPSYAKEELVAELTAAMVSSTLGFDKRITENSAAYLKGWAAALRKEPKYIISVMSDVNKASRIELEHIDKQRKALGQKSLLEGTLDGLDEKVDNEKQFEAIQNGETEKEQNNNKMDKKIFYSNLNDNSDIELKEDPQQLAAFYENGDKQGLFDALKQAQKESGASWNLATLQSTIGENAEIIAEDEKHIAVKYPYYIPGTFFMFEKVTEQQILHEINQYGLSEDDSDIAKKIGNEAVKKQFDGMRSHALEMPNGTVLGVDYDPSTNEMMAGGVTNAGLAPEHRSNYDHSITLDENIQNFSEELMSMEEYQVQEEDIEEEVSESQEETLEKVQDVDKAEKMAKEKFEDINHENMHKEEERKSAEQEKKEVQQKEQQKKKEEEQKKENKNSNAVTSHAALLVAALVSAKNNNGVWLNPGFRKDAQFLFGNSPITGYNALMMNLHGEQNGYRSNIYTQYNPAKDNGMPIKEGEKTFYLSWTNWRYVKGAEDKQGISPKEYHALDSKEKKIYQPRPERKVMNVWNIDQTTFAGKDYDAYVKVIKENGDQVESLNTIKEENIARAYSEVVKKHPDFVVLQLEDDVFKAYKKGAEKISKATGIPMTKVDYLGKKVNSVEISKDKLDGYLSKIVNSGNQVVICDKPESPKLIKTLTNPEEVLQKANSLAKSVAKTEGLDYERVMVVQDAQYLPGEKKIVVSGMSDPGMDARSSAIAKANDIYRVLAAMTGTSDRLDRGGHVNLTPIDDVKYEKLVRELTAGVFMARQGLPATFSKESMELVPYWEREIKESPRMVSIIEKDVNNAVEVLDRLEKNIKPDYKKIVGMKAEKQMLNKSDYTIIKKINEFPNIDTKEIVVVKDTVNKKASVILPQGASLEKDNEVPGMRKDRIKNALSKEGFEVEKFYNAGGRLGLKQPNNYFADKEISVVRLHQYELVSNEKVDLSDLKKEVKFKIKDFQVLPDKEQGRYFFHIQAEGEKAFDIVPEKKYVNSFFKAIKSPDPEDKSKMIKALSEQFYKLGKAHPEMTEDLVSPRKVDVDMSRISSSHIYKDSENHNIKYIKAVIDGQEHVKVIPADQYNKLFAAEDKPAYAKALAAVTFESLLKKGNTESVDNSQKEANEKAVSKATPIEQSAVNKTVGQQEDNEHHQSMKFGRR